MNTNQIGKISELEILTYITKLGYSVSVPFGDKDRYDQIWDINGKLIRVQIKTSRWKNDQQLGITFNCYSVQNGKKHIYNNSEIDYFATYWDNKVYLIPVEECSQEKTLWFKLNEHNYSKCAMAKDYEVEGVLKNI